MGLNLFGTSLLLGQMPLNCSKLEIHTNSKSTNSMQLWAQPAVCNLTLLNAGKAYIDASTVSSATSVEIAAAVAPTGALFLEAPVSGSKGPAEQGQLIFLAAGAHTLVIVHIINEMLPYFHHCLCLSQATVLQLRPEGLSFNLIS